jgi:signal peptidase II
MKFRRIKILTAWLVFSISTALLLRMFLISENFNGTPLVSFGFASLNLQYTINTGVNFGLAAEASFLRQSLFALSAIIISAVTIAWCFRTNTNFSLPISGLFAGGGLANAYERIAYGGVFDYLNLSLSSYSNPYSFNIADIYIFVGLLLFIFKPEKEMN